MSMASLVNRFLNRFDLHLTRSSSFRALLADASRPQTEVTKDAVGAGVQREQERHEQQRLLTLSQKRWRADEPDAGLTWGVRMVGDQFVEFLLAHCRFTESSTIVEVGPGYGRLLSALLERQVPFLRYVGLEISAARVARLRERFNDERIEFRETDILGALDWSGGADVTISSAVFEHLYPDFRVALQTIWELTRPGGTIVFDLIQDDENLQKAAAWFSEDTYMRIYSLDELKALFSESGFALERTGTISFGKDVLNREIRRTILLGRKEARRRDASADTSQLGQHGPIRLTDFETLVNQTGPACDHGTLEPPVRPEFRNAFGGLWTDLSTADALVAGKVATGELSPDEGELVHLWRSQGFIILPSAVEESAIDDALEDFERALDGALRRRMSFWDHDGHHIEDASREFLNKKEPKLLDLHDVSEATQAIQFAPAVSRALRILFERPALAFQSLGFYHGSRQPLHQDTAFVRVNSAMEFVASWIALEDIQPGSGELEYYPGSHALPYHLFGGRYLWAKPGDPEVERFSDILHTKATSAGLHLKRFLPKKGDVLIWSAGLMHGGSTVTNPTFTRKSLVTHYCPAELQPMYAYKGSRTKRKSVAGNYIMAERWH